MKLTRTWNKKLKKWEKVKDYRGDTLWKKADGSSFTCNYLGELKAEDTDVPAPIPFYHDWNEGSKSWIENKEKKKNYLIDQLNVEYDVIFAELHKALVAAIGKKNQKAVDEIEADIEQQVKDYEEKLKKINNGSSTVIPATPPSKYCPRCGTKLVDNKCPACGWPGR